jgi:ribosomal protein S18 acetylase RimI-like enzyme
MGIAVGFADEEWPDDRHLVSMWVDPRLRGSAVATQLVEAVCDWACGIGAAGVVLWVVDGNDRARAFYRRLGFVTTGRRGALRRDPSLLEECYRRPCR